MDADVAIIGAGPYGLSTAAHLAGRGLAVMTFGRPMDTWREHMPAGMLLKSDGFASSLDAPVRGWTLREYCRREGTAYGDREPRVKLDVFTGYGMAFQQEFVPELDHRLVSTVTHGSAGGFTLTLDDDTSITARRVVVAVGITHFAQLPAILSDAGGRVTHSSSHREFGEFAGKSVAVVGAGSSAVEVAAALLDVGADVHLVTRRPQIPFWAAPDGHQASLRERILNPSSGLGPGWKQKVCEELPDAFRLLSKDYRLRIVERFLGPVSGWWLKERVLTGAQLHLGTRIQGVRTAGNSITLALSDGAVPAELTLDHVIAATGYVADVDRLPFLDERIRHSITRVGTMPSLSWFFQSSVPGLYFIGLAAAGSFGPLMRFMVGAELAAPRVANHLVLRRRMTTRFRSKTA